MNTQWYAHAGNKNTLISIKPFSAGTAIATFPRSNMPHPRRYAPHPAAAWVLRFRRLSWFFRSYADFHSKEPHRPFHHGTPKRGYPSTDLHPNTYRRRIPAQQQLPIPDGKCRSALWHKRPYWLRSDRPVCCRWRGPGCLLLKIHKGRGNSQTTFQSGIGE